MLTGVFVVSSVQHRVMREEDRGSKPRGLGKERKRRPQHNPQFWWPSEQGRHGAASQVSTGQTGHTHLLRWGGGGEGVAHLSH